MAAARKYPRPDEQLVAILAAARRRGLSFEEAWDEAVRPARPVSSPTRPPTAVGFPADFPERAAWKDALAATRSAWERAFNREPPSAVDVAMEMLRPLLAELAERPSEGAELALAS